MKPELPRHTFMSVGVTTTGPTNLHATTSGYFTQFIAEPLGKGRPPFNLGVAAKLAHPQTSTPSFAFTES
jgi:hypothetical protein